MCMAARELPLCSHTTALGLWPICEAKVRISACISLPTVDIPCGSHILTSFLVARLTMCSTLPTRCFRLRQPHTPFTRADSPPLIFYHRHEYGGPWEVAFEILGRQSRHHRLGKLNHAIQLTLLSLYAIACHATARLDKTERPLSVRSILHENEGLPVTFPAARAVSRTPLDVRSSCKGHNPAAILT